MHRKTLMIAVMLAIAIIAIAWYNNSLHAMPDELKLKKRVELIIKQSIENSNNVIESDGEKIIVVFDPQLTYNDAATSVTDYLVDNKLLK